VELATPGDGDTFERFSRIRKITGRITSEANVTIPHVLSVVEADHSGVMAARSIIKARGTGAPPTALAYVAVAVTRALGEHPRLNASVGDGGLVLHGDINLAFAIDTDDGLVAPVVKHADQLTVTGMADAIVDLATRARAKKLLPADMAGATFSISNNGSVGSVLTAPIITPPQVAVLSTDKVVDRAVVIEQDGSKAVAIRPIGNLAMSWDHRAVDGAGAARFLSSVKEILETTDWSGLG
jgi:2-oxoglutarate dehydrogenase E2 component (dihydrolipoamide succinyltransferase)